MKKIGPCNILRKVDANSYEIELPYDVGISCIFNISDLYPYKGDEAGETKYQKEIQWEKQMTVAKNP